METSSRYPVKLMLDSGAYSAWNQPEHKRKPIDLDAYISFCVANQPYLDSIVNLDVIPGERRRIPTVDEVEESARQGYSNLNRMEEHGLSPIPVFHQGERWYWLERLIGEGYTYLGISPANDRTTRQKRDWLDEVFELIPSSIRTHAYGMTQIDLLFRYPFYSCDSMTWLISASFGGVMVPKQLGYTKTAWFARPWLRTQPDIVKVTDDSRKHRDHYEELPGIAQLMCRRYWTWASGFGIEELNYDYVARAAVNVRVWHSIERQLLRHHKGRFGRWIYAVNTSSAYSALLSGILRKSGQYDPDEKPGEYMWVDRTKPLGPDEDWYEDEHGEFYGLPKGFFQPHRLMSYWELSNQIKNRPDFIQSYVTTGLIEGIDLFDKFGDPIEHRLDPRRPHS